MFQRTAASSSFEPIGTSSLKVKEYGPRLRKLVLTACCGSFLFGFSVSLLNTSLGHIVWELDWCDYNGDPANVVRGCSRATRNEAFINTSLFIGATIGSLMCNRLLVSGRRRAILLAIFAFAIGAVNTAVSGTVQAFFWARLITGWGLGVVSVAVPTYISEMTPCEVRGYYGAHHQLLVVTGIFVAALLGLPMQLINPIPDAAGRVNVSGPSHFSRIWWRLIVLSPLIPIIISTVLFIRSFPFETPHWLLLHNRRDEAKRVLEITEGEDKAEASLLVIQREAQQTIAAEQSGMNLKNALGDPGLRNVIVIGCLLSVGQQVSGINVFMARSSDVLQTAGLSGAGPVLATTLIFLLNVVATVPAVLLIEKAGRRALLLWGTAAQTICLAPAMLGVWIAPNGPFARMAAAAGMLGFVIAFALAYGPVLWVALFEMFPSQIKQTASSLAVGCNWTAAIIMVFISQFMSATATFTTFTLLSLGSWALVYFYIKETSGISLGDSPYMRN